MGASLSSSIGDLFTQPGVLSLQRFDLRLDLPLEGAPPFGELSLVEQLEPAFPVEQLARNGTQLRLLLICYWFLSRWQSRFFSVGLFRSLLGGLWLLLGGL